MLAADLGASAMGFVFWPGSPRYIDPYRARAIAAALPPGVMPVGVFVDQPVEFVMGVARLIPLGAVQLHGSESIESFARVAQRLIKAVPVTEGFEADVDRPGAAVRDRAARRARSRPPRRHRPDDRLDRRRSRRARGGARFCRAA